MYKLNLTHSERKAIDWVGYRYATGDEFRDRLHLEPVRWVTERQYLNEQDWKLYQDIEFHIPEAIAWEIRDLFDAEELTFPCFDDSFKHKLIDFYYSIV